MPFSFNGANHMALSWTRLGFLPPCLHTPIHHLRALPSSDCRLRRSSERGKLATLDYDADKLLMSLKIGRGLMT